MKNNIVFSVITLLSLVMPLAAGCSATPPALNIGNPMFGNPKKSAHYESNTPAHGAIIAGVPVNVVIDFNFDQGPGSSISILNNGKEYGIGETRIDTNKLAMRRNMDPGAPDGI